MKVQVLVADDHQVVRSGLCQLFEGTEINVVAEAGSGSEALEATEAAKPDVVLLDVRLNGESGLDVLERIKEQAPDTPVIMLSAYKNPTYVARAVALGACDYIVKETSRRNLISAVMTAAAGKSASKFGLMRELAATMAISSEWLDEASLTGRETQVLRHIALGLSNKDIACSLDISIETVKEHVRNTLRKVKASDRTQAAVWALRKNLV